MTSYYQITLNFIIYQFYYLLHRTLEYASIMRNYMGLGLSAPNFGILKIKGWPYFRDVGTVIAFLCF